VQNGYFLNLRWQNEQRSIIRQNKLKTLILSSIEHERLREIDSTSTEPSPESSIGGLYICSGGHDILKIDKTQLVYSVPYFNFGGLELCLGGLNPPKPPTWRRDCTSIINNIATAKSRKCNQ